MVKTTKVFSYRMLCPNRRGNHCKGPSIYDVRWFLPFFDPPPSSMFYYCPFTYEIRFGWTPLSPTIWLHIWLVPNRVYIGLKMSYGQSVLWPNHPVAKKSHDQKVPWPNSPMAEKFHGQKVPWPKEEWEVENFGVKVFISVIFWEIFKQVKQMI